MWGGKSAVILSQVKHCFVKSEINDLISKWCWTVVSYNVCQRTRWLYKHISANVQISNTTDT